MLLILKEVKETILYFFQETVKVLQTHSMN